MGGMEAKRREYKIINYLLNVTTFAKSKQREIVFVEYKNLFCAILFWLNFLFSKNLLFYFRSFKTENDLKNLTDMCNNCFFILILQTNSCFSCSSVTIVFKIIQIRFKNKQYY